VATPAQPPPYTSWSRALIKRAIALELQRLRTGAQSKITQQIAAKRIGRTAQHVSLLESAQRLPSPSDMEILLTLYGVPERVEFFRELLLAAAAKKGPSWWAVLGAAVPKWFDLFLNLEAGAAELSSFDALLVTGLLQTPEYAEAVIRADPDLTDEEVHQRVELRMTRQHVLDRPDNPVRLWTVLDESVLYRRRGGPDVTYRQLEHLLLLSDRPRIDIQVLPLDAGAHMAQQGGTFILLKFPPEMVGDPGVVYHELVTTGVYCDDPAEVARYERILGRLHALAATQKDSRAIIERAMKEVRP